MYIKEVFNDLKGTKTNLNFLDRRVTENSNEIEI